MPSYGTLIWPGKAWYHGGMEARIRYRDVSKRACADWVHTHRKKWRTFGIYAALIVIGPLLQLVFQGWTDTKEELPMVVFYALGPPIVLALGTLLYKLYLAPFHFLRREQARADLIAAELHELQTASTDMRLWEDLDAVLHRCIELGEQLIRFTMSPTTWDTISEVHNRFGDWVTKVHDGLTDVRPEWASHFSADGTLEFTGLSVPALCDLMRGFIDRLRQIQDRHRMRHPSAGE